MFVENRNYGFKRWFPSHPVCNVTDPWLSVIQDFKINGCQGKFMFSAVAMVTISHKVFLLMASNKSSVCFYGNTFQVSKVSCCFSTASIIALNLDELLAIRSLGRPNSTTCEQIILSINYNLLKMLFDEFFR